MFSRSAMCQFLTPRTGAFARNERKPRAGADPAGQDIGLDARQRAGRDGGQLQEERYTLPLRKGGQADVRRALGRVMGFDVLRREDPEHFFALLAIAEGRPQDAPPASVAFLKEGGDLTPQGEMRPDDRAVLLSSFEVVGDGPTLVNPFDLQVPGAREIIGRVQEQILKSLRNLRRRGPGGHGR